jgi:hypothetical protein
MDVGSNRAAPASAGLKPERHLRPEPQRYAETDTATDLLKQ